MEKACRFMDEKNMKQEMEKMKNRKMRIMIKDGCNIKDYIKHGNLYSARNTWKYNTLCLE